MFFLILYYIEKNMNHDEIMEKLEFLMTENLVFYICYGYVYEI